MILKTLHIILDKLERIAKGIEVQNRLLSEIHARILLGESPATNHSPFAIDKKVKEMLHDNFVPLQLTDKRADKKGMNS